ncbi:MAG: hypothetical protein GY948_17295 [Alphaproteobacteria bacterium]|nr:hypothetical protein [Alphaproteobacteria bacterium]
MSHVKDYFQENSQQYGGNIQPGSGFSTIAPLAIDFSCQANHLPALFDLWGEILICQLNACNLEHGGD